MFPLQVCVCVSVCCKRCSVACAVKRARLIWTCREKLNTLVSERLLQRPVCLHPSGVGRPTAAWLDPRWGNGPWRAAVSVRNHSDAPARYRNPASRPAETHHEDTLLHPKSSYKYKKTGGASIRPLQRDPKRATESHRVIIAPPRRYLVQAPAYHLTRRIKEGRNQAWNESQTFIWTSMWPERSKEELKRCFFPHALVIIL